MDPRDGGSPEGVFEYDVRMGRASFLPVMLTSPVLAALLGGCGLLTGAESLVVGDGGSGGSGAGGAPQTTGSGAASTTDTSPTTGGAGGGAGGAGTGGAGTTSSGTGGSPCPPCGMNQVCEAATGTCQCSPGFVLQSGNCEPVAPGDPTTHTEVEVCQTWKDGHVVTTPDPLDANGDDCDAGTLKQGAINDTLARINMFRWLSGLGPTTADDGLNAGAQLCANLEAWWDFGLGVSPHSPPAGVKCYTAQGAQSAGMSNIAWGSGHPAQAIDQFMQDNGNATTMGHRRWIVNPPLNPVGVGYWQTGGQYGNAECLSVFGQSGNGPSPSWVAVPNQGFVPLAVAAWTWTFHGTIGGIANAQVSMLRVDDNTPLDVKVQTLQQGYGQEAISWSPQGWTPEVGKTYRVTVKANSEVVYDVKPVACN